MVPTQEGTRVREALEVSLRLLEIANRHGEIEPLLADFCDEVRAFTGCDAVGIRMLDEEGNIPYQAYQGFTQEFYESESPLSVKSDACMCVGVIKGSINPDLPCHTPGGSFYVNGTTRYLAETPSEQRAQTRNVCNEMGWESVALVPIRVGERILGLIHVADREEDKVPLEMVAVLEGAALELGTAIQRVRAEQALRQARDELETRVQERTAELAQANEELRIQMAERQRAEERRRRVEARMLQAQKLESLGVLAGGIAHDFNNLLVSVVVNASMALNELPPESPGRDNVQQIETAALRAADLARQLLAYSGRGQMVAEPLDLSVLVEEMAGLLEVSIPKNVAFRRQLAGDLPPTQADATQLRQVVMNLVTNAAEAMDHEGGLVTVRSGVLEVQRDYFNHTYVDDDLPEGRYVYLGVSDTGCGMDEETLTRIFDPFFSTKFSGRGLGLAAVLGIVRGHKGAIKVDSEPGQGTTFKVLFPCLEEGQQAPVAKPEDVADWRGSGTILLVDDEESVRFVVSTLLERLGFEVLTASDGLEAVEVFREHAEAIAAVLLDVTMPHMDGHEAFRQMRAIRADAPVILSSGYAEDDAAELLDGQGPAGFIEKPYRPAALVQKLREVLES